MTFSVDWLRQPALIRDGRLPAHSDHRWFSSYDEATRGVSRFEHDLCGQWDFRYYPSPAALPADELLPSLADEAQWQTIPVPGHIQLHGWDRNRYVNMQHPWDGWEQLEPGDVPWLHNPVGVYRRVFDSPALVYADSRVRLRFEGAESAIAVWLNGQWVGYSTDGFTPAEFDISDALVDGPNTLLVLVFMWHAGSWVEDQDFFRFAGLHRPVTLVEVPATHVEHVRTTVKVAPDLASAHLSVRLYSPQRELLCGQTARVHLRGAGGLVVELNYEATCGEFVADLPNPRLWSAEDPYLYDMTVTVGEASAPVEVIPQRVGVRRFEIVDSQLMLNGKRLVFKGVNRHEFGPNGRVVSPEMTTRDLLALKAVGCNAVRTSHYPNSSHLYAECDRLGLYVIDEMNLESHALWDRLRLENLPDEAAIPGCHPEWLPTVLDRAESMLMRDVNHASIVMWSLGNESYGGTNLVHAADFFRSEDTRPVHYEGTFWDPRYPQATDVLSSMYVPAADIEAYLADNRDKPYLVCEYAHAMGNSFGAVDKYMALARREPLFHGGFIWDFADQAVRSTSPTGEDYWAYGGDSGEAPHDAEFCGNGIFFADHTPTPKIQEVRAVYAPFDVRVDAEHVEVTNDLLFTSSAAYTCRVVLAADGVEVASAPLSTDVPPGETRCYELPEEVRVPAYRGADSTAGGWGGESAEAFGGAAGTAKEASGAAGAAKDSGGAVGESGGAAGTCSRDAREWTITVSFYDPTERAWAPANHEVAFGQAAFRYAPHVDAHQQATTARSTLMRLPEPGSPQARHLITQSGATQEDPAHTADTNDTPPTDASSTTPPSGLRIVNGIHNIGVHGPRFSIIFSKLYGGPVSYRYGPEGRGVDDGRQLLTVPPRPCFWHAPTSNERGWHSPTIDGQWLLASRYARVPADAPPPTVHVNDSRATIRYDYELPTIPPSHATVHYTVDTDGRVEVTMDVTPGEGLGDMPECGMLMAAPRDLTQLRWYGEGPDECYVDRRKGARLGIYDAPVAQQHTPYLRPQESGNRTGVRWVNVTDATGNGLRFDACDNTFGMEFSAQPWSPFEVENARHDWELPPVSHTWLRPALMRRGVGGDNSWGAQTHDEYCLPSGVPLRFRFAFQGIASA